MKFLDVRTDYAFKKVFGSEKSKPQLISFLNALLEFPKGQRVEDLEIVDPYNIPMIQGMKDTYVDVKARLDDGSLVIIEMQVLNVESFEKRILYNAAKNYSTQLVKGENYDLLNPVIALTLTDFEMFPESDQMITRFKLMEKKDLIEYSDDIELVFVELPKFTKKQDELDSVMDRWLYFVKNAGSLECIPGDMDEEIQIAFRAVDEASMTVEELENQHKRMDFIWLQKKAVEKGVNDGVKRGLREGLERGMEKGREEGREEGREAGVQEGLLQVAKKMKTQGMTSAEIHQCTGISL